MWQNIPFTRVPLPFGQIILDLLTTGMQTSLHPLLLRSVMNPTVSQKVANEHNYLVKSVFRLNWSFLCFVSLIIHKYA